MGGGGWLEKLLKWGGDSGWTIIAPWFPLGPAAACDDPDGLPASLSGTETTVLKDRSGLTSTFVIPRRMCANEPQPHHCSLTGQLVSQ